MHQRGSSVTFEEAQEGSILEDSRISKKTNDHIEKDSRRYRVAKTHRIPYLYRSFSAKVTYI